MAAIICSMISQTVFKAFCPILVELASKYAFSIKSIAILVNVVFVELLIGITVVSIGFSVYIDKYSDK